MCGRYVKDLTGIDNEQINEDVLKRKTLKLDDTEGNTFAEDSFYPETEACSCLLYTSPSPRDAHESRMPSSA